MPETFIELSEDAFAALFPLIPNHLNPSAWLGSGRGEGLPLRDLRRRARICPPPEPADRLDAGRQR